MDNPSRFPRPGHRALAAIVFTDVVNYSARMQENEVRTLKLVSRDFEIIKEIAAPHQGAVMKTTGDGLLLYFSSAVQAVACALAVQRRFTEQAKSLPAKDVLTHRVGIHLGDVFVSESDVMGDGVNIAARLQAEAEPGGIAISQTVYDVVKNKLALKVTSLGARELKNISQSIPVYNILLEAQALDSGSPFKPATGVPFFAPAGSSAPLQAAPASTPPATAGSVAPRLAKGAGRMLRSPAARTAAIAAAALVVAVLLVSQFRARGELRRQRTEAQKARAALRAAIDEGDTSAARDAAEFNRASGAMRQQLQSYRSRYLASYDFAGLSQAVRHDFAGGQNAELGRRMAGTAEQLSLMKEWVIAQLQQHSRQNPLRIRELSGSAPKSYYLYAGQDRRLYFVGGGAVRGRSWDEISPDIFGAAIVAVLLQPNAAPGREVLHAAAAFARLYNRPEMMAALRGQFAAAARAD